MRYAIVISLTFLLQLPAAAVRATTVGDASHCRPLSLLDDARNYIDCIDEARQKAIRALSNTRADGTAGWSDENGDPYPTHPDHNPDLPLGGYPSGTDEDGTERYKPPAPPAAYQRYEQWLRDRPIRTVYTLSGRSSIGWVYDRDTTSDGETVTLRIDLQGADEGLYIEFARAEDGAWQVSEDGYTGLNWEWTEYGNDDGLDEAQDLIAMALIAIYEGHDMRWEAVGGEGRFFYEWARRPWYAWTATA